MASHIIKWMLTASIVISGIISAEEDSEVKDQFQNLFDSIAKKNSIPNSAIYRNILKQKVEQEKQIFHEMKNEIHIARNKMYGNVENVGLAYKNMTKRQSETEDGRSGSGSGSGSGPSPTNKDLEELFAIGQKYQDAQKIHPWRSSEYVILNTSSPEPLENALNQDDSSDETYESTEEIVEESTTESSNTTTT